MKIRIENKGLRLDPSQYEVEKLFFINFKRQMSLQNSGLFFDQFVL